MAHSKIRNTQQNNLYFNLYKTVTELAAVKLTKAPEFATLTGSTSKKEFMHAAVIICMGKLKKIWDKWASL